MATGRRSQACFWNALLLRGAGHLLGGARRVRVEQIKRAGDNFSYMVWDGHGPDALVIDPGLNSDEVLSRAEREGLEVRLIIATHHHMDHSAGISSLRKGCGAEVAAHRLSPLTKDRALEDEDALKIGGLTARIIHTPGHTEDGICILVDGGVFTGDTLFVGECGRTDLPGGDSRAMYESLFGKLLELPDDTIVYPGHDYGSKPYSTIGAERRTNYTLKERTLEEFVAFMREP